MRRIIGLLVLYGAAALGASFASSAYAADALFEAFADIGNGYGSHWQGHEGETQSSPLTQLDPSLSRVPPTFAFFRKRLLDGIAIACILGLE